MTLKGIAYQVRGYSLKYNCLYTSLILKSYILNEHASFSVCAAEPIESSSWSMAPPYEGGTGSLDSGISTSGMHPAPVVSSADGSSYASAEVNVSMPGAAASIPSIPVTQQQIPVSAVLM